MIQPIQQPDIHDMVRELTTKHTHSEPYTVDEDGERWTKRHPTTVPALVHQLLGAAPSGSKTESGSTTGKSKPAARIEAIDTLMLIDDEAARWIRVLGHDDPGDTFDHATERGIPGSGTIACLNMLHGLHASVDHCEREHGRRDDYGAWCCTAHHIEHDLRRWWHQARIITGWDLPAYRPYNSCPVCERRGGLRINITINAGLCVECRSIWEESGTPLGLLAEHIRAENGEDEQEAS